MADTSWIEELEPGSMVVVNEPTSFSVKLKAVERLSFTRPRETGIKEPMIILKGGAKFDLKGKGLGIYRGKYLTQVKGNDYET